MHDNIDTGPLSEGSCALVNAIKRWVEVWSARLTQIVIETLSVAEVESQQGGVDIEPLEIVPILVQASGRIGSVANAFTAFGILPSSRPTTRSSPILPETVDLRSISQEGGHFPKVSTARRGRRLT